MKKRLLYMLFACLICTSAMAMQNNDAYLSGDKFERNGVLYTFISKTRPTSTDGLINMQNVGWVRAEGSVNSFVQQNKNEISDDAYATASYALKLMMCSRETKKNELVDDAVSLRRILEQLGDDAVKLFGTKLIVNQIKEIYVNSDKNKSDEEKKKTQKWLNKIENVGNIIFGEFTEDIVSAKDLVKMLGLLESDRVIDMQKVGKRLNKEIDLHNKFAIVKINNNFNTFTTNTTNNNSFMSVVNGNSKASNIEINNARTILKMSNLSVSTINRIKNCYLAMHENGQSFNDYVKNIAFGMKETQMSLLDYLKIQEGH